MTDQKAELEMKTLYQITGNAADINTILINRGEFRNLRARVAELEAQLESIGAGGVGPLMAPVKQAQQVAAQKDAVFKASIDFIGTLTGMKPPPIETAPPEIFEPFRNFTERVCSIFFGAALTSRPLMKTSSQNHVEQHIGMVALSRAVVEQAMTSLNLGIAMYPNGGTARQIIQASINALSAALEQRQDHPEQGPDAFYEWWSMRPSLTRLQAWLLWKKDQAKSEGGAA